MKHLLACLLTLIVLQTRAQQIMWKRFNNTNGLKAASIICITQTADRLIWLGTQDGLIVYNGNRFEDIYPGNFKPYIEGIIADNKGRLWLGCRDGLRIYTPSSNTWQSFTTHPNLSEKIHGLSPSADTQYVYILSEKGLLKVKTDNALDIAVVDTNYYEHVVCEGKNVWAHTKNSVVVWQNNRKKTVFQNTPVYDLKQIPGEKRLLAVTAKGLRWINPDFTVLPITIKAPVNFLKLGSHHVILPEADGKKIWIKQYDSVFCLNGLSDPNPEIHYWNHLNPYSIPQQVLQLFSDRDHNIWILSGGDGLGLLSKRTRSLRFVPSEVAQTSTIWNVLEDAQTKQTVYCTQQSVVILNQQTGVFKKIKHPLAENRFTCSQAVQYNSQYWIIGTYGAGAWLLDKHTHQYKPLPGFNQHLNINAIHILKPDSFLFLTTSGVFTYVLSRKQLYRQWTIIKNNVFAIARIPQKGYWMGFDNGIYEVDLDGKHILQHYNHDPLDSTSMRDNVVFGLHLSTRGDLYVATSNGGVNELAKGKHTFTQLPLQQNPANIYGCLEVSKDSVLFLAGDGIYLYLPEQRKSRLLGRENGLQIGTFAQFGYSSNGQTFYFTGGEGAIRLERSQLPTLFSDTLSMGTIDQYVLSKQLTIPAGTQQLQLEIVNQNKGALANLQYAYQLLELDEEWHDAKTLNEINYPYIPPGDYVLNIRATDPTGIIQTQTTTLTVSVLPLWFQTRWFLVLVVLTGAMALIMAVRYFSHLRLQWNLRALEAKQKVTEERLRISRELHDNVGSQLTYLITGLEASEVMLEQHRTEKLSSNLEQLQASARDSMQQLRDAIWALNKEEMTLQLLADRFKNWTLRMLDNQPTEPVFEFDIQHNRQLDAIATLSIFRLLQESVHNIIKHAQASSVHVSIVTDEHSCTFLITDNGIGFTGTGEGSGLENMRSRATQIGAVCTITSKPQQGTSVQLVYQNR